MFQRKTDSPVKENPVKKVKQDSEEAKEEEKPHANGDVEATAMQAER